MPRHILYVPLSTLAPADRNPKRHDKASLARSISRFGFVEPMVRDDRTDKLVSGHGRRDTLLDAYEAELDPPDGVEVDDSGDWLVPVVTGWASRDEADAEAFLLAVNKIGQTGGWDTEGVAEMLQSLAAVDYELDGLGFPEWELESFLGASDTWTPPEPTGELEDFQRTDGNQHAVKFDGDGLPFVEAAIALVRELEGNPDLTRAEALVLIAQAYLAAHETADA